MGPGRSPGPQMPSLRGSCTPPLGTYRPPARRSALALPLLLPLLHAIRTSRPHRAAVCHLALRAGTRHPPSCQATALLRPELTSDTTAVVRPYSAAALSLAYCTTCAHRGMGARRIRGALRSIEQTGPDPTSSTAASGHALRQLQEQGGSTDNDSAAQVHQRAELDGKRRFWAPAPPTPGHAPGKARSSRAQRPMGFIHGRRRTCRPPSPLTIGLTSRK